MNRFQKVFVTRCLTIAALVGAMDLRASAQLPDTDDPIGSQGLSVPQGDVVPREVREMTERGLKYLVDSQSDSGTWTGGEQGPGTTGLGLLAFLASGEDPNFGPYSSAIRKALRSIVRSQDKATGYMGNSMYHHGFATLALAEAYGTVDETDLWTDSASNDRQRSLGEALELAREMCNHFAVEKSVQCMALFAERARRGHFCCWSRFDGPISGAQRGHRSSGQSD